LVADAEAAPKRRGRKPAAPKEAAAPKPKRVAAKKSAKNEGTD